MALQKLRNINIDFSDRRTQLAIGGVLAVVIIVIVLLVFLRKPAGGGRPPVPMGMMGMMGGNMPGGGGNAPGGNTPSGGGAPAGGMPGMGPMMMGMGGGAAMGAGGMTGQGGTPTPTRKVPAGPPKEPSRADPFEIPIPKQLVEEMRRVDIVPPPRLTSLTPPMPTTAIVQVPFRRMAGITIAKGGVYALMERNTGQMIIVSPGDTVDGFTVERIEADKVVLKGEGGEETVVEMKGATAGAGMPGMGGMMPGAGMVPGMGVMPGMMPGGGMMPGAGMPGMGGMPGMPGQGVRGQ
jgi:hypothetical protein